MSTRVHSCIHGDHSASAPSTIPMGLTVPAQRSPWWRQVIAYLRRWSGDDAYERYVADHRGHGHELLSRREFYKRYLDKRAGGSRCC
jgi:uncharacterized short protein YbdD (DUF466 family)